MSFMLASLRGDETRLAIMLRSLRERIEMSATGSILGHERRAKACPDSNRPSGASTLRLTAGFCDQPTDTGPHHALARWPSRRGDLHQDETQASANDALVLEPRA